MWKAAAQVARRRSCAEGSPMTFNTIRPTSAVQQLLWRQENGYVVVTPRDHDRYVLRLHDAMEALKMGDHAARFKIQFALLQRIIAEWILGKTQVSRAFLTVRDGALSLVVVRSSVKYDAQFEDELSELDLAIANDADLGLIRLSSIALPMSSDEAIESFLNSDVVLEYIHGASDRPHSPGESESCGAAAHAEGL